MLTGQTRISPVREASWLTWVSRAGPAPGLLPSVRSACWRRELAVSTPLKYATWHQGPYGHPARLGAALGPASEQHVGTKSLHQSLGCAKQIRGWAVQIRPGARLQAVTVRSCASACSAPCKEMCHSVPWGRVDACSMQGTCSCLGWVSNWFFISL